MSEDRGDRLRELEETYRGYTVYDRHYEKVGKVDDLFIDENDEPEYIGVKMGFLGMKSALIPMELVRVNDRRKLVEVAADEGAIKDAPTFDDDKDITPEYEDRVHGYFGLERPGSMRGSSGYGGYYASGTGARSYPDEELRRSVDTEYGERLEPPERPAAKTFSDEIGQTNLDIPLGDAERAEPRDYPPRQEIAEPRGNLADTGETRQTEEGQQADVEVQGDRNVRVHKRVRARSG